MATDANRTCSLQLDKCMPGTVSTHGHPYEKILHIFPPQSDCVAGRLPAELPIPLVHHEIFQVRTETQKKCFKYVLTLLSVTFINRRWQFCKTALDLTAPASDALLKNRKNAWIQVAGHPGSFAPAGPNTIWKKRMEKENYETKAYQALMGEALRDVVPKFYREVEYNGEYFIEMEDLLQHFQDPNIMDIKMGKRTFLELEVKNPVLRKDLYEKMVSIDPDAPMEEEKNQEAITKLRYMQFREQESSTAELGFRIEAIRMSGEPPNTNLKKTKQKEQVAEVILNFFKGQMSPLQSLLTRLIEIMEKFENSTFFKSHEIIGSSLLIMYDAENCGAWMIDFAKTIPMDSGLTLDHRTHWRIGTHEDGYLSGLDNLIRIIECILNRKMSQEEAAKDNS